MNPHGMDQSDEGLAKGLKWLNDLANRGQSELLFKVRPLSRNELEQLHYHASRMVKLLELVTAAQNKTNSYEYSELDELAELADPRFLRHMQSLFTKLAERDFTLIPQEDP